MREIIKIENGVPRMPIWKRMQPIDFCMQEGEHIAIVGGNGGGKSVFADIITGKNPLLNINSIIYGFDIPPNKYVSDFIKHIRFRDCYGGDTDVKYYLQQRWNQAEIDDDAPSVLDRLAALNYGEERTREITELSHLTDSVDKKVMMLSSGELRRLILAEAILSRPKVLIIDNPFIGLDCEARQQFSDALKVIAAARQTHIILLLCDGDIPKFITHVVEVNDMTVGQKHTVEAYIQKQKRCNAVETNYTIHLPDSDDEYTGEDVLKMRNISIRYGERIILKNFSWSILNGERWALTGPNGSGKSTLLSLICADNPQGYACQMDLFGCRRGKGETIWEIKKRIGYVSPELHRAFKTDISAVKVVASGLKDSMGVYSRMSAKEYEKSLLWMKVFEIEHLAERGFLRISSGEQRMVLLARAFVKSPSLLVLDEPMHGLDKKNKARVKKIIDTFYTQRNKTLIFVTHYEEELPTCINMRMAL